MDSGYLCTLGFLPPYHIERYHLRDFRGRDRPKGAKKLFNYRHSSLHNVIERCFGILKARFPVLKICPVINHVDKGMWWELVAQFITSFKWQQEMIACLLCSIFDNLTVEGEGKNNSSEPLHNVDLTNQAVEAMATYRNQIVGLMLANNRHHWFHVIYLFIFGWNWFPGKWCHVVNCSYWSSFLTLN